jgi:hypothetical protein
MPTFARAPDGRLLFDLYHADSQVLVQLMQQLSAYLRSGDADPRASERLFPRAYLDPTEEDAENEFQAFAHDELLGDKLAAFDDIAAFVAGAEAHGAGRVRVVLGDEQETHLLLGLNDARLTLAALAGEAEAPAPLTDWLGALVAELTDLQLSELPETGIDGDELA